MTTPMRPKLIPTKEHQTKYKNNHKRWTKDEVNVLKEYRWHKDYLTGFTEGPMNILEVAAIACCGLGRTPQAIVRKVYRLKLHLRKPYWATRKEYNVY